MKRIIITLTVIVTLATVGVIMAMPPSPDALVGGGGSGGWIGQPLGSLFNLDAVELLAGNGGTGGIGLPGNGGSGGIGYPVEDSSMPNLGDALAGGGGSGGIGRPGV